jgi:CRISPR/Cas system-associated endoribonuclease Cas2
VKPGSVRLRAGADGYIKDATVIQVEEDSEENATALLTLFPIPPDAGFHGIGAKSYVKMIEAPVEVMATEMTTFHGIKDIPKAAGLPKTKQAQRSVFQTTLREQELKRMDIHLSKLDFQEKAMVTGLLGDEEVDVNLWVAGTEVSYKVKSMEAADNYLVATEAPLESGVYAFHSQGILDAREADALNKLPKEMKIVYAFEVP